MGLLNAGVHRHFSCHKFSLAAMGSAHTLRGQTLLDVALASMSTCPPPGAVESAFGFVALSQSCFSICRRMPQGCGGALLGHGVAASGSRFQLQHLCMSPVTT